MLRKAATELRIAEGHRFGLSVSPVILITKTYLLWSYILNTLISDGYILFGGLSYVNVKYTSDADKLKYLIVIASILIGLFQAKFLKFIDSLFDNIFQQKNAKSKDPDS